MFVVLVWSKDWDVPLVVVVMMVVVDTMLSPTWFAVPAVPLFVKTIVDTVRRYYFKLTQPYPVVSRHCRRCNKNGCKCNGETFHWVYSSSASLAK